MNAGKSRFRPGLWPTLAMLVLCALFLRLALWQWDRAAYKRHLLAAYSMQMARKPVSLNALLQDPTLESFPQYLKVDADGAYDGGRQLLLEDMTHEGTVGYEVLTPFQLSGSGYLLLVDRGWVPATTSGAAPEVTVMGGVRRIQGVLGTLPVPGLNLGKSAPPNAGWPKILFYPQAHDVKLIYGAKLMAPILHLDAAQSDGYLRQFSPDVGFPPERHLAYAFQWIMLAAAVFAVWLVVNLKAGRRREAAK
ncbi:MAG TPA: SURF1 family protein [Gammaproteobacteria bacterium]|nr:SURF1 family protein [Gammaproteobacteria bacterium]